MHFLQSSRRTGALPLVSLSAELVPVCKLLAASQEPRASASASKLCLAGSHSAWSTWSGSLGTASTPEAKTSSPRTLRRCSQSHGRALEQQKGPRGMWTGAKRALKLLLLRWWCAGWWSVLTLYCFGIVFVSVRLESNDVCSKRMSGALHMLIVVFDR